MKWILLSLLATNLSFANINKAPKNFKLKDGKKVIFVDFKRVDSEITYNVKNRTAKAQTIIEFETFSEGHPLIDLVPNASNVRINELATKLINISAPDKTTSYKMINTSLKPGIHQIHLSNNIKKNINFKSTYVSSAFWMSDLSDRAYIERYLPSNIEYDQYQMNLKVKVIGDKSLAKHEVYTNGTLNKISQNEFMINFPQYFTASSFYFHITKKDRLPSERFNYTSINGKAFPVVIYAKSKWSLSGNKERTIKIMQELESKLGAWSHPSLTIYIAGQGGMEHSGATITSESALGHELIHSYFARGVMPVDGNSGWMDEAIASWRDNGYRAVKKPSFSSTSMSAHSQYQRFTDRRAYSKGANFMEFLDYELQHLGGLITFLKDMHAKYTHKSITTHLFKKELELFAGRDFTREFDQYIFGKKGIEHKSHNLSDENPYHPKLTAKELKALL